MDQQSTIHNTFVIERSYSQPVEQVFSAFADATKKRRWYGESENHEIEEFEMDFRVGGAERFQYRFNEGMLKGVAITNQGSYQDIVPNRRIVFTSRMTLGDKPISASLVTIELLRNDQGTDLICTHQGTFFEGADGPQMREGGWRRLFDRLDKELTR